MTIWNSLDSLRSDVLYGWRQIVKRKAASAAAILSLALAMGACTSAFRLIDALLLRPLPISTPERLYSVAFQGTGGDGKGMTYDSCSYPMFRDMRAAVRDQAEAVAVSYAERIDLTYRSDEDVEKASRQFVSGGMFETFGLHPAVGRLLNEDDDGTPGAHPVAVLSHDYWMRRFAGDPSVIGRTFRMDTSLYEVVGVAEERFTGTETGTVTDLFVPIAMKNPLTLASNNNFWLRTLVMLKAAGNPQVVHARLNAAYRTGLEERVKGMLATQRERALSEQLLLEPAASGRSNLQRDYRRPLSALAILVLLVLLIACANVANLMTAQAAARAKEMALRISIGASRSRLVRMVLMESAWIALLATVIGAGLAWWSAPFIVQMINPRDNPARLVLPADWRVLAFGLALAAGVTFLFGLAPALRASAVNPLDALKGGSPSVRGRLMLGLVATQIAFCFVVFFAAGLLVTSFEKLTSQAVGFSSDRVLNLETTTLQPSPAQFWDQVAEHLRSVPGVETVTLTVWPLMSGESAVSTVSVDGAPASDVFTDVLHVAPGWVDAMKIPWLSGADFRLADSGPSVAIVNQAFAKQFMQGQDPVGKLFTSGKDALQIVGYVHDARSRDNLRIPVRPTIYVPIHSAAADGSGMLKPMSRGTFVVRTSAAAATTAAPLLRKEVSAVRPEFRVSNVRTQAEINLSHTLSERLMALLALFFAGVAILLAGVGLYGVLDYSVAQRRREIGIRMAIGAQAMDIARRVTAEVFRMVLIGAAAGLVLGLMSVRFIEALLYQVQSGDPRLLALPILSILSLALLAAIPPVIRAIRTDPATILRSE
jgi:putative ABC transport system permease protein